MIDLIDRQAAIDALTRKMVRIPTAGGKDLMHDENRIRVEDILVIKRLPSAEPKKGKWVPHREMSREYIGTILVNVEYKYWFCDACFYRVENGQPMYNFCPNCGTRMEG